MLATHNDNTQAPKQPTYRSVAIAAALCFLGLIASAQETKSESTRSAKTAKAFRLLIADATAPTIRVIDLVGGSTLATFKGQSPARLHGGASGRYVYAAQTDAGAVSIIDTGISVEGHGDHSDITIRGPRLLSLRLRGPRPSHVTHGNDRIAVFFDGDGTVQTSRERDLVSGHTMRRLTTNAKHHGVAQPIGRLLAVTIASEKGDLPDAIELRDSKDVASQRLTCPRLHGEAVTGRFTAFGCADGVAIYELGRDRILARHIAYPPSLPPGRIIRNLAGATGFTFFAGDFGADGMVVFDPSSPDGDFRFLQLPARRMHFNLHPEPGDKLYVIVEDGSLLKINPISGNIDARAQITGRYPMDPGIPRPRIASVGPYVAVSDPAAGQIVILNAETLAEGRRLKVGGAPFDVQAVGATGVAH